MNRRLARRAGWLRRKARSRKKITGTAARPRLNVFRSNKHIYAQVINDLEGRTVAAASTLSRELADKVSSVKKAEASKLVGELVAKKAKEQGVEAVVFDRSGYIYHGRIKALADGAREAGLKF